MPIELHPGTRPDEPDARDRRFRPVIGRLPRAVDLSSDCGPVFQQRMIHSCSANAIATALMLIANRAGDPIAVPSRLFMYYNARAAAGDQRRDNGTTIRTAIKAVARYGACPERQWPYRVKDVLKKPPRACYDRADVRTILYHRMPRNLDVLRTCLAQGDPFVFGISAYERAFTRAARTRLLELPETGDVLCGGHALAVVGYDRYKRVFLARNSLGANYGRDGFFWIDERYFAEPKLSYDFWRIRRFVAGA